MMPTPQCSPPAADERFAFGKNWQRFLQWLDDERIREAERSLNQLLAPRSLAGRRFLDVGCGSGLFSLAARNAGAIVHSFDYDPQSVACAQDLRGRYRPHDREWTIESGSALDADYLRQLGPFDVVYSWGVLHHTGDLWQALDNVRGPLAAGGCLAISIYNDQGRASRRWTRLKRCYNRAPRPLRGLLVLGVGGYFESRAALIRLLRGENPLPFATWAAKKRTRGMSAWHDLVDWVGGYPFEVARPEQILDFYRRRGFMLERLTTQGGGHGCNEYVFVRRGEPPVPPVA